MHSNEHPIGDVIGDGYHVVSILGRGGSAITYEAETQQGQRVAIKQLLLWHGQGESSWKRLELFEREARTLASLSHPAIPRYFGSFQIEAPDGQRFYLVRELIEGKSLAQLVEEGWRGNELEVRAIARALLAVLAYLHGLSPPLVHRDIKPSNIIRRADGHLFLVDFGAVRDTARGPDGSTVVGTYGFMAPEQFRGQALPASDLYGIGATTLFLLTHRPPSELPQQGLRVDLDAVDGLSPRMRAWIGCLLEPDPDKRPRRPEAAADMLDDPRLGQARKPSSRRIAALSALLVTVIAGAGAVAWLERERQLGLDDGLPPSQPVANSATSANYLEPLKTLTGQWRIVYDAAFSSDGSLLVAAGGDQTLKLWNVADEEILRSFVGHTGRVHRIALSSDDTTLLSGGVDGARVWSVADGAQRMRLKHAGACYGVAVSPDGKRAATGSADGKVFEWSLPEGEQLRVLSHGGRRIHSVAYSADGELLAASGDDGRVVLWGRSGDSPRGTLVGHKGPVNKVVFSSDGRTLVTASDDHTVKAWDVEKQAVARTFDKQRDEVWALALSPDEKTLLTAGKDDVIRVYDLYRGTLEREQPAHLYAVADLEFSPDGKVFVAAGGYGSMRLWNAPGAIWRPPLPPENYQEPPRPTAATPAERLARQAEDEIDKQGTAKADLRRAQQLIDQALELDPKCAAAKTIEARVALAKGFLRGHDYRPGTFTIAHALVDEALAMDPRYGSAWRVKGWIYRQQRNFGDARKMADKAAAVDPDDARTGLLLADLYAEEGRWDECLQEARKVLEKAKRRTTLSAAWADLYRVYIEKKAYDAAEDTYIAQMRLEPDSAWIRGNYANFLVSRKQYDRAIEMVDSALKLMNYGVARNTKAKAHGFKAYYLLQAGELDEAKKQLDLAFGASEQDEVSQYVMGLYWRKVAMRDRDASTLRKAKEYFERALALEPDYQQAKKALAEHPSYAARLEQN